MFYEIVCFVIKFLLCDQVLTFANTPVLAGVFANVYWLCYFLLVNICFVLSGCFIGSTWKPVISGILLALFWQQSGMLMHDFMRSQVLLKFSE